MYTTQEVVDLLDQEGPSNVVTPFLDNLRPQSDNKHGNSFLHEAIARNRTSAAIYLIALAAYRDKPSLFMKDGCPSSKSTPLILASKTGNNHSALLLVGLYKNSDRLNARDYIGNTALHYACLMRNNLLIEALILQGADANIRNHEGKSALEYYLLEASSKDLKYYYGECDGLPYLMSNVCDWGQPYQGTNHSSFSNYRWFLIHIVINFGLAKEIAMPDLSETQGKWWFAFDRMGLNAQGIQRAAKDMSFEAILNLHLKLRRAVIDSRIYNALAESYIAFRNKNYSPDSQARLKKAMLLPIKHITYEIDERYFSV